MTETAAPIDRESSTSVDLDTIVSLCKRRGFVFQSSEIYGGLASTWDYGPLGVELKRNIKESWWRRFVLSRDDMVGLDSAILMHPEVWRASGHVESFADPLVECKNCNQPFRADHVIGQIMESTWWRSAGEALGYPFIEIINASPKGKIRLTPTETSNRLFRWIATDGNNYAPNLALVKRAAVIAPPVVQELQSFPEHYSNYTAALNKLLHTMAGSTQGVQHLPCPNCGGELTTDPRSFNLMFRTFMGPVEDAAAVVYLRPETAQGIFANLANVVTATRRKLPFGIAQIGKAFRNEITTGKFIFRTREFEMMEIEYFVKPGDEDESHRRWVEECRRWYTDLGLRGERLRAREHAPDELAHYSKKTVDIEYQFPWGWGEIQGIASRTDFDLRAHSERSGQQLSIFDEQAGEHVVPYVVEPSAGVDRAFMAFLVDAYTEEDAPTASGATERRVVLRLHPALAPVKVAVLPLSRNERLVPLAREVYDRVRGAAAPTGRESTTIDGLVQYDDAQSIGRRYRRQDEIGTPFCVTVDFESLDDRAVTIRERDSMTQARVSIAGLPEQLARRLAGS